MRPTVRHSPDRGCRYPSERARWSAIIAHAAVDARKMLEETVADLLRDLGDENTPTGHVIGPAVDAAVAETVGAATA